MLPDCLATFHAVSVPAIKALIIQCQYHGKGGGRGVGPPEQTAPGRQEIVSRTAQEKESSVQQLSSGHVATSTAAVHETVSRESKEGQGFGPNEETNSGNRELGGGGEK